ncbi:TonB-dependent receptor [Pedobacter sp. PAMC26386]|nr:TonB-dependent receptor [Pedobacter sp. PAMC26386]
MKSSLLFFRKRNFYNKFKGTTLILITLFLSTGAVYAQQSILDKQISIKIDRLRLEDALLAIAGKAGCSFVYATERIDFNKKISISFNEEPLGVVLKKLFGSQLSKVQVGQHQRIDLVFAKLQTIIKGRVLSDKNEPLSFVTVQVVGTKAGVSSDIDGNFQLENLKEGKAVLRFTLLGDTLSTVAINAIKDKTVDLGIIRLSMPENMFDNVIITATRTPEQMSVIPARVNLLRSADISTQSQIHADMTDILGWTVPGLSMGSNTTSNRSQTLRGRNILVLIDGIPQSTPLRQSSRDIRTIDPSIIDRIEIVKGATAIYGNGAEGGVINYITKKPVIGKKIGGMSTMQFGSDLTNPFSNSAGYRFSQQLYGTADKFDFLVSGTMDRTGVRKDGDGVVLSPRYGLNETNTYNGFAKIGYNINKMNRIELMYNFYNSTQDSKYIASNGVYGETPTTGIKGENKGAREGTRYNHNAYLQYTASKIFANTDLNASLYYQNFATVYDYREPPRWKTGGQAMITANKFGFRPNLNTNIVFSEDWKTEVVYGLDVMREQTAQPLVDGRMWVPKLNSTSMAPYIQIKNTIAKNIIFKAGLRYDNIRVNIDDYTTLPSGKEWAVNVKGGDLTYKNPALNLGLVYTKFAVFSPFFSFSQGFSIFDLGRVLREADENTINKLNTEPVSINNYEIGFNSQLGKHISLSASYFDSRSKLGADLESIDGFWVPVRAPQYIRGVDINADIYVNQKLSFGVGYGYQEGKADIKNDNSYSKYLSGLRISPSKLTAYVKYAPVKDWSATLFYIRSGERNRFVPNEKNIYAEGEGPVNAFGIFNLSTNYQLNKAFMLGLGIENLFDKTYYTTVSQLNARNAEYVHGNGALFNLSLNYKF